MNVRIFWVRAMKCMCAQTRPRFILSSERVFWGMEFEPMLTQNKKKSPLLENFRRIQSKRTRKRRRRRRRGRRKRSSRNRKKRRRKAMKRGRGRRKKEEEEREEEERRIRRRKRKTTTKTTTAMTNKEEEAEDEREEKEEEEEDSKEVDEEKQLNSSPHTQYPHRRRWWNLCWTWTRWTTYLLTLQRTLRWCWWHLSVPPAWPSPCLMNPPSPSVPLNCLTQTVVASSWHVEVEGLLPALV